MTTFHRKNLPSTSTSFSSPEGRTLFQSAMNHGYLESYFRLAEVFSTQGHPSFCGLGTLAMALNALLIDPNRVWQGIWRWFDEYMLDCCEPLDVIKEKGMTIPQFVCLAECNGAAVDCHYANNRSLEQFRADVISVVSTSSSTSSSSSFRVMVVSYSRRSLQQTGSGHFSPLAAYDPLSDKVLIMDVARFKYSPHWVSLPLLYEAMLPLDKDTGCSRGYLLLASTTRLYSHCQCRSPPPPDSTAAVKEEDDRVVSVEVQVTKSCCRPKITRDEGEPQPQNNTSNTNDLPPTATIPTDVHL